MNEYYAEPTTEDAEPYPDFPWPPADGESIIAAMGRTWRGAALEPRRFFVALPEHAPLTHALIYYLVIGVAVEGVQLFWATALPELSTERHSVLGSMETTAAWSPVLEFLFSPLLLLLSLFIAAAVVHLLLRLFAGSVRGFGVTTRVFCYSYSPQVLAVVPFIGAIAGFAWMVVIAIIGLAAAHRTTTGRAAAAVLIPVAFAVIFIAIATFLMAAGSLLLAAL